MSEIVSFANYTPPERFDSNPWTQAQIEEAPTATGPWTTIDTVTLDPVDDDPADPQPQNFTTANGTAPDLWYRVSFLDDIGGAAEPTTPEQNSTAGAAFANHEDFADRIGETLTGDEKSRVDNLLARVSTEIRRVVGQSISEVTDDVLTLNGTTDRRILLPERPVQSVSSVTLDGTELAEGSWFRDGNELVRRSAFVTGAGFTAETFGRGFGYEWQTLEITYTHGYPDDEIPGIVKEICCEAVVRAWFNPASIARETVGDTTTTFDNNRFSPSGLRLTSDEKNDLKKFFGLRGGSIAMKD